MDTNIWVKKGLFQFMFILNIIGLIGIIVAGVLLSVSPWIIGSVVGCLLVSILCSLVFSLMDKTMEQMQSLRYALDYMGDAIMFTDEKGMQLRYVNKKFCELTGYTQDELAKIWPTGLWGEHTDKETVEEIRNAIRFRRPIQTVITSYKKDGSRYTSDVFITPVFAHGECINFISIDRLLWEEQPSCLSTHPCDKSTDELLVGYDIDQDVQPGLTKLPFTGLK